jgi:hypothetical protein
MHNFLFELSKKMKERQLIARKAFFQEINFARNPNQHDEVLSLQLHSDVSFDHADSSVLEATELSMNSWRLELKEENQAMIERMMEC